MDIYDPQTLGIMVFGGFMVVSAIGIALVSTLSMKETSYEEALAKQRRELAKAQPQRTDKKKKVSEKKSKGKKREEKPNGKLPEQDSGPEPSSETSDPELESEPELPVAPVPSAVAPVASVPVITEPKSQVEAVVAAPPAPSPKDKKKKKGAKVDPVSVKSTEVTTELITKTSTPKSAKEPVAKESAAKTAKEPAAKEATAKAKDQASKVTKEPAAKEPVAKAVKETKGAKEPAAKGAKESTTKEPAAKGTKEPATKGAKEPATKGAKEPATKGAKEPATKGAKEPATKGAKEPATKGAKEPATKDSAPKMAKEPPAKVAKEAATKEPVSKNAKESVAKVPQEPPAKEPTAKAAKEPTAKAAKEPTAKAAKESNAKASKESSAKSAKEPNVKTVKEPAAKNGKQLAVAAVAEVAAVAVTHPKSEQPKPETPSKKKSKKKADPAAAVDSSDVPLLLPFKTLVSTLHSSVFTESETQKLLDIIGDKAGADTWQLATQKGDPLAALKKQLEEKEKLLSAEQENSVAAKTRIRELTKELSTEKSKMASVETRLSSELSAREQEITALHARMKASYDEHTLQTKQLTSKIQSLQDQLENGPKAQLARLQQENSILRDALNQATSMAESRQNAELTTLRQDCVRLSRELNERTNAYNAEEERRKALEFKVTTSEEQLAKAKAGRTDAEQSLQKRLDKAQAELNQAASNSTALQTQLKQVQQEAQKANELQERVSSVTAELKDRCAEVEALKAQLAQAQQGTEEQIFVETQAPLQAGIPQQANSEEVTQLKKSVKEKEDLVGSLQQELEKLKARMNEKDSVEQQLQGSLEERQNKVSALEEELKSLREEMERQKTAAEIAEAEQPFENLEKDARLITLEEELQQLREQLEEMKTESKELRVKNNVAAEALIEAQRFGEERLNSAMNTQNEIHQKLDTLQIQTKNTLQKLFPHISIETEQSNWLEAFSLKAQDALAHSQRDASAEQNMALTDALQKLQLAEESQTALQAQCEQYRATLSETESLLKDLQHSVQDGEAMWSSKVSQAEQQLQEALAQVKQLEDAVETLRTDSQSTEQLKGQVMLLEAQLEKQLESISFSQSCANEVEQLKTLLSATQNQLDAAQSEAQKQQAELSSVTHQLQAATEHVQNSEDTRASQVLTQTKAQLTQVEHNYDQAQKRVRGLEAQLEELKAAGDGTTSDLKERLEKEVKLTQELNEATASLQQLLKSTQDELSKEKETMKTLQEQLHGKEGEELKEGTSV